MRLDDILEGIIAPKRDYKPVSNSSSIEEFMKTSVYRDFLCEIQVRIEDLRDFYEECEMEEYLQTRGGLKLLRLVSGIFSDLLSRTKEETE